MMPQTLGSVFSKVELTDGGCSSRGALYFFLLIFFCELLTWHKPTCMLGHRQVLLRRCMLTCALFFFFLYFFLVVLNSETKSSNSSSVRTLRRRHNVPVWGKVRSGISFPGQFKNKFHLLGQTITSRMP